MPNLILSNTEARQLSLSSQGLNTPSAPATALTLTQQVIEHLGYIQIDTISVIQRAHHHTLWTRHPNYQAQHLEQLLEQKQIFEYWSHAAAYLPMRDYRFSLWRKQAFSKGQLEHWYQRDPKLIREVLARIRAEGPVMAKDFDRDAAAADWQSKPSKRALEYLFMQGDLMIPYRRQFHKVYDLTERVLPSTIDTRPPTEEEYVNYLILHYLKAQGLAQERDFGHLITGIKPAIKQAVRRLLSEGQLIEVQFNQQTWLSTPDNLQQLNQPQHNHFKILSPFDNLVIQRERLRRLFNFDYQIECYLPAAKRHYGYFSLPILWNGEFVARIDCKAERKIQTLTVNKLWLEPSLTDREAFHAQLMTALRDFAQFNHCHQLSSVGLS